MRRALLTTLALISTTSLAAAQPGASPSSRDADAADYKDPNRALLMSASASALGLATLYMGSTMREGGDTPIMMVGTLLSVVGPSVGAWYVKDGFTMTPGLGIRVGGLAVMGLAFGAVIDRSCVHGCDGPLRDEQSDV
ncbi:MAG: hypothetical protein H0T79_15540, partial [Deltaproteobacteria bacterium]|nr:hypothetical protein [Deltaproteobacteria bacterium]